MCAMSMFNMDWILFGKKYVEELAPFNSAEKKFWDPTHLVEARRAEKNARHLAWQYDQLQKNIGKVRRRLTFFNLFLVLGFIAIIIPAIGFIILIICLAIWGVAWSAVRSLKVDITKYAVLKEKGWLYDPAANYDKGRKLSNAIPEIFVRGNGCYVEDEFWGSISTSNIPIYGGEYSYTKGSGKEKQTYYQHYFMCKLPKLLPAYFKLGPELPSIFGLTRGKEIEVESIAFNKKFKFYYTGKKEEQAPRILKILTPSVQVHLMALAKKKRGTTVLFKEDMLVFLFNGKLMKQRGKSILRTGKVSQADINYFDNYLNDATAIAQELTKRLS